MVKFLNIFIVFIEKTFRREEKMLKFDRDFFKYLSLLGTLGFIIIGNMLVSLAIYKYIIARYIYESPILFIIFLLLGIASGFYSVYQQIMKK